MSAHLILPEMTEKVSRKCGKRCRTALLREAAGEPNLNRFRSVGDLARDRGEGPTSRGVGAPEWVLKAATEKGRKGDHSRPVGHRSVLVERHGRLE